MKGKMRLIKYLELLTVFLCLLLPSVIHAASATMQDYCQVPPFIGVMKPNLLLMIDNSGSMFDLAFEDTGMKHCSNSATTFCTVDADCGSGGTCSVVDRQSNYCYDETYSSTKTYAGYFDQSIYYQYDFSNDIFNPVASFSCVPGAGETAKQIINPTNQLCIIYDTSLPSGDKVTKFLATGNYLNWLSASKFDIEKQVLTGGKYVTQLCSNDKTKACTASVECGGGTCSAFGAGPFLMAESRGCVGQEYIKDAMVADFVNYSAAGDDTNIPLGIAFTVTGPKNPYNDLAPSPGGQTYINIYAKSSGVPYDYYACQQAVVAVQSGNNAEIKKWVDLCLAATNKPGKCQQDNSISCASSADCARDLTQLLTANICSGAPNLTCATDADCKLSAGNFCSGKPSLACASDASCQVTIPTQPGICTDNVFSYIQQNGKVPEKSSQIKTAGSTCTSDNQCSFDNYVAQSGACTGLQPSYVANYGTCTWQDGFDGGTCVANNVGPCVLSANDAAVKTKVVFQQALQECWSIRPASSQSSPQYGFSNMNTIKQMCPDIYTSYKTCSKDGKPTLQQCTTNLDCGAGNTCLEGPAAIGPGNPAILCGLGFAGVCFEKVSGVWKEKGTCEDWDHGGDPLTNSLANSEWRFCKDVATPPVVVDPTNPVDASTTTMTELPPILSSISVAAQMGSPLKANIAVRVSRPTAPTGVVQDFATIIRMGLMRFNTFGSSSESGALGTQKVCSNDSRLVCSSALMDCGGGTATCDSAADLDGGKIITYMGQGRCSATTSTACGKSADCPAGETCSFVGDHSAGLTNAIDALRASTWTPHAEGFYNAIGYYAESPLTSAATVRRLSSGDFNTPIGVPSQPAPSQSNCQKNNILLITDGQSTADLNSQVSGVITSSISLFPSSNFTLNYNTSANNACVKYDGSMNIEPLSWLAQHGDITDNFAAPAAGTNLTNAKIINTYVVYSGTGSMDTTTCANESIADLAALNSCQPDNRMCKTARYGGGRYYLAQDPDKLKKSLRDAFVEISAKATSGTAASVLASGEGSGANLIQALFYPRRQFDSNSETLWAGSLQNLWYYIDPFFTYSNIREDTKKDNILILGGTDGDYIANMQMLGNCVGTGTVCTSDADCGGGLNSCSGQKVRVKRYRDDNGDGGTTQTYIDTIDIEDIHSLWEAGKLLWSKPASSRKIFTSCNIVDGNCDVTDSLARPVGLMNFKASNLDATANLLKYLQASSQAEADKIVGWTRGYDKFCTGSSKPCYKTMDCSTLAGTTCSDTPLRPRTVTIDLNGNGTSDPTTNETTSEVNVWKLGDVLNSTPKIASWMPLNTYNKVYGDPTYGYPSADHYPSEGKNDAYFITTNDYFKRGVAFAGSNDGMLHAFKLGTLGVKWASQISIQKATLGKHCTVTQPTSTWKGCLVDPDCDSGETCVTDTDLGQEAWAFLPKNALPYLKYIADPNYCHVYSVDLTPYIFDASIEGPDTTCTETNYWNCVRTKDSWRTVLIGGMRLGGGCRAKVCSGNGTTKCASDADCAVAGGTCGNPTSNTIGTPLLDPADTTKGFGYSSYFALDITDNLSDSTQPPRLLWEFSDEQLGFSSTGPAILRIRALKDPSDPSQGAEGPPAVGSPGSKDGRWFVVFGSGPTGPISDNQFLGYSDQNLRLFVLDLKTGSLLKKITMDGIGGTPDIPNAFSGSLLNASFDSDLDYQDDAVYLGYVRKCGVADTGCTTGTWTSGGVGRLVTGDRLDTVNHDQRLDPSNWTFSILKDGTGPVTTSVVKLQDNTHKILWVYFGTGRYFYKTSTVADDNDQTRTLYGIKEPCFNTGTAPGAFDSSCSGSAGSITDVTSTAGGANGDESWSINMAATAGTLGAERVITDPLATSTGLVFFTSFAPYSDICTLGGSSYIWAVKYDTGGAPGALLKGKALVQVSTGKIEQVDLATQFTEAGGRRTVGMEGVPPTAQGLSIISSPPPIKRVLHMRER